MKKYMLLLLPLFALSVAGCKKTKLEGDLEPLAGEWRWVNSVGACGSSDPDWCFYTPEIREETVGLLFEEKGRFEMYEAEKRVARGRVQVEYYDYEWPIATWSYDIDLKPAVGSKVEEKFFKAYFLGDTMIVSAYPYNLAGVLNYFVPAN